MQMSQLWSSPIRTQHQNSKKRKQGLESVWRLCGCVQGKRSEGTPVHSLSYPVLVSTSVCDTGRLRGKWRVSRYSEPVPFLPTHPRNRLCTCVSHASPEARLGGTWGLWPPGSASPLGSRLGWSRLSSPGDLQCSSSSFAAAHLPLGLPDSSLSVGWWNRVPIGSVVMTSRRRGKSSAEAEGLKGQSPDTEGAVSHAVIVPASHVSGWKEWRLGEEGETCHQSSRSPSSSGSCTGMEGLSDP